MMLMIPRDLRQPSVRIMRLSKSMNKSIKVRLLWSLVHVLIISHVRSMIALVGPDVCLTMHFVIKVDKQNKEKQWVQAITYR